MAHPGSPNPAGPGVCESCPARSPPYYSTQALTLNNVSLTSMATQTHFNDPYAWPVFLRPMTFCLKF